MQLVGTEVKIIIFSSLSADDGSSEGVAALRLVGGATPYLGQLQVFYNSRWGKVCDHGWDSMAAAISCSQLGQPS